MYNQVKRAIFKKAQEAIAEEPISIPIDMVSIIVPIYNKKKFTLQMLKALWKNTEYSYELILIDNNSTDGSEEAIKEFANNQVSKGQRWHYIKNSNNKGFSIANNQGARVAKGKYLCFLNNDTIPLKYWLKELVECHIKHKSGITGAKLILPGKGIIQHAGIMFDNFKYPYHKNFGFARDSKEVLKDEKYDAVTGACMLIERETFFDIGCFDEDYWLGWEDIDLCNRFREAGYEIWYASKSELYHYESMSEGRYSKEGENWYKYSKRWVFNINK